MYTVWVSFSLWRQLETPWSRTPLPCTWLHDRVRYNFISKSPNVLNDSNWFRQAQAVTLESRPNPLWQILYRKYTGKRSGCLHRSYLIVCVIPNGGLAGLVWQQQRETCFSVMRLNGRYSLLTVQRGLALLVMLLLVAGWDHYCWGIWKE